MRAIMLSARALMRRLLALGGILAFAFLASPANAALNVADSAFVQKASACPAADYCAASATMPAPCESGLLCPDRIQPAEAAGASMFSAAVPRVCARGSTRKFDSIAVSSHGDPPAVGGRELSILYCSFQT
jgi:hypothetical protein